jgi:hypothetical protein
VFLDINPLSIYTSTCGGFCYHERTTLAVRMAPDSRKTVQTPIKKVQVGDEILKMTNKGSRDFTKVTGLPHSPTTQQMYAVELKSKYLRAAVAAAADEGDAVNRLEATAYHTFPRCAKNAQKEEVLVHVKDLKVGDCLQTLHSDKLVTSVEKVKTHKNELTYSVITEGGKKDMIVVGGQAVAHATDAIEHTKIMKRLNADAKN